MFYSYIIYDPVREEPFYVGKGKGSRIARHLKNSPNKHVRTRIKNLREVGFEPIIQKIECSSEQTSFDLERGLIKTIGRKDLGLGPLFNFTDGGEGTAGMKRPDLAERNKMNAGKPSWNKGIKWSSGRKKRSPMTEKHIESMRNSKSVDWLIITPTFEVLKIKNLRKFCRDNYLNQGNLHAHRRHKNWNCVKLSEIDFIL